MSSVLQEIIELLVGGITQIATGIGTGLGNLVKAIFLNAEGTGLSTYGGVIVVFAGVSLAIALCTRVVMWVENLGK